MAETITRHMIVADFDNEFRLERVPDILLALVPTAGSPRSGAREVGRGDELFELFRESRPVGGGHARSKAYVIQQTLWIVESEEERSDGFLPFP